MTSRASHTDPPVPVAPDIDDQGVDRTQIRDMLALEPEERLRRVEELLTGLLEIRSQHEARTVR